MHQPETSASGPDSAWNYNADPMKPTDGSEAYECIPPRKPNRPIEMLFFDGSDSLHRFDEISGGRPCGSDLKIARWERLTVDGKQTWMQRGGGGWMEGAWGIRHGHVEADELRWAPSVAPRPANAGKVCPRMLSVLYRNLPQGSNGSIPSHLTYKDDEQHSQWDNYGNQEGGDRTPYNYLLWTWPVQPDGRPNRGGGLIRATIKEGERIRPCDVEPVYLPAYGRDRPKPYPKVATVKMMYGRIRNADAVAYGWFVQAWRYDASRSWSYLVLTA